MNKKTTTVLPEVAIQSLFRPDLSPVSANKDFDEFRRTIVTTDRILVDGQLEELAIDLAMEKLLANSPEATVAERSKMAALAVKALRTNVLRNLLGGISCREFSRSVYMSELLADFCRVLEIDGRIKGLSKSEVDRMFNFFDGDELRLFHGRLTETCANPVNCKEIGMTEPVDSSFRFFDGTCVEANIHYPVDWVLLRDVSRTLLRAITLIRNEGIFCRMPQDPKAFAREMNRLCIAMTHGARRKDSKKLRKKIFRGMKKLLTTIGSHGERYRAALAERWEETGYTEARKDDILRRMDDMLAKLPLVKKQAHERIIGGRPIANKDKIHSVYEDDVHVIVRRKAGKHVEFGNTLMICENADGYIMDWRFYKSQAPSESAQLKESLERQSEYEEIGPILAAVTDRGFNTEKTGELLREKGIFDATCPRDPDVLKERMKEPAFAYCQRRRSGTEARIAILNQRYGGRLRQKGSTNRSLAIDWAVLSHNLWLVARMIAAQEDEAAKEARAA